MSRAQVRISAGSTETSVLSGVAPVGGTHCSVQRPFWELFWPALFSSGWDSTPLGLEARSRWRRAWA